MGAYSELDAVLREDDDAFMDGAFADDEDDNIGCARSDTIGEDNSPTAEPTTLAQAKPSEDKATAQPAGDKTNKDAEDEDAKRKAHEEAEAKRKAEWEAKQRQKKEAEQLALAKLEGMSDDEVLSASVKRVGDDTERLTRRNMKECVAEHIQTLCLSDPAFARKVMHPRKSMIHCVWYINRKAREFIEQEMKDNDIKPENGIYGGDVPDDLCYQWAVDYFNDPNAKEDEEKEEKFVPKAYPGKASTPSKKTSKGKAKGKGKAGDAKKADNAPPPKQERKEDSGDQMSLLGVA